MSLLSLFRFVAIAEGISYLGLFITMPLKYVWGMPEPNIWVGMTHGVLFIAYVGIAILYSLENSWSFRKLAISLIASLIPAGTFYIDRAYLRTPRLNSPS
jgi:integral membrane protein